MNLNTLKLYCDIARLRSFSEGAAVNRVSQSAASQAIQQLEADLEVLDLAIDCLRAGRHVWMEKPPAATCAEIERMQAASRESGRGVMVGFKKMFFPANEQAKALMDAPDFGRVAERRDGADGDRLRRGPAHRGGQ